MIRVSSTSECNAKREQNEKKYEEFERKYRKMQLLLIRQRKQIKDLKNTIYRLKSKDNKKR